MDDPLSRLAEHAGPLLLVEGGSGITEWATPTSDRDLFALADPEGLDLVDVLFPHGRAFDAERRTLAWLERTANQLVSFEPALTGSFVHVDYYDLRFLIRTLLGRTLVNRHNVKGRLFLIEEPLRRAAATLFSGLFCNQYQDAVGFLLSSQWDGLTLEAGLLAQRALLLAVLQHRLVDPSTKWAPAIVQHFGGPLLRERARELIGHVASGAAAGQVSRRAWGEELLHRVNSVVAAGMLAQENVNSDREDEAAGLANATGDVMAIEHCLMGVPGFITAQNTLGDDILLCNRELLRSLAYRRVGSD